MWFCDECGAEATGGDPAAADPPVCAVHGPRWRLVRNVPCTEVIVERDGKALLGRRAREPLAGMWEIPGGFVDRNEHPVQAGVREMREELGIDVTLTGLVGTYLEISSLGECLEITAYVATTDATEVVPDPGEVSEFGWFAPGEFPEAMAGRDRERLDDWAAGRIVDLPADGLDPTT
jgi:8-oxo-dGTP diphosphatase